MPKWLQYCGIGALILVVYFVVGVIVWGCAFANSVCEDLLPLFYPVMLFVEMLQGNL